MARRTGRRNPQDPSEVLERLEAGTMPISKVHFSVLLHLVDNLTPWQADTQRKIKAEIRRRLRNVSDFELKSADQKRYAYLLRKERQRGLSTREWEELLVLSEQNMHSSFYSDFRGKDRPTYAQRAVQERELAEYSRKVDTRRWEQDQRGMVLLQTTAPYNVLYYLNEPLAIFRYLCSEIEKLVGSSIRTADLGRAVINRLAGPGSSYAAASQFQTALWVLRDAMISPEVSVNHKHRVTFEELAPAVGAWHEVLRTHALTFEPDEDDND